MPRGGIREGQNTIASQTANLQFEGVTQTQAAEMLNVSPRNVAAKIAVVFLYDLCTICALFSSKWDCQQSLRIAR